MGELMNVDCVFVVGFVNEVVELEVFDEVVDVLFVWLVDKLLLVIWCGLYMFKQVELFSFEQVMVFIESQIGLFVLIEDVQEG